jgi:hypothetical protein
MFRSLLFTSLASMLSGSVYAEEVIDDASVPGSASLSAADNVRKLAGCFAVTYQFAEDGSHDLFNEEYGLDKPTKEWVANVRDGNDHSFTLVHVSITDDARAVPHWHEIWAYRPNEASWTQEVWSRSPDDQGRELRYQCTAPWHLNRWECHAGRAPKPFRDYGAPFGFDRTDYEHLDRENILLVTDEGWVQNEHNKKIAPDGTIVAHELGWITYRRLPDQHCEVAIDLFSANAERE